MLQLTPFLLFDGNCAEAMDFYHDCFGGTLTLTRLGDTPMKDQHPPAQHHKVTYAHLKSNAVELSATDWLHPTHQRVQGNATALFVTGTDAETLRAVFDKLAVGANPEFFVPLTPMPFGLYGRMTDRFGIEWFFRS
jgi:PhnB protein